MRNILVLCLLILTANAQADDCGIDVISFSVTFANAFENGDLKKLDNYYCLKEKILITVEHSLGGGDMEPNGKTGETAIKSFNALDRWLESRRVEERPWPAMWPLKGCSKGVCEFGGKFANQAHGYLFLKAIYYKKN